MRSALADRSDAKAGLPRWWAAGLSLFLALVVLVAWLLLRPDEQRADLSDPAGHAPRPAQAAQALQDLARAWSSGDEEAARDLAAADDAEAAAGLAAVARTVREAGITRLSLRYVDGAATTAPDGTWPATADLTWQVRGVDSAPARADVQVRLRVDGDRVAIAGLGGGEHRSPVWLTGPAEVDRTGGRVVVVASSLGDRTARRYRSLVAAAVPRVRDVLPHWPARLVVEVPGSADGVDRALGAEPGTYARVAAVTASADGTTAPGAAVRVVVNPDEMARLGPTGAGVVMTHELAHVALGAATSTGSVPLWLVEGTADVVALDDVRLPITQTAGQVIAQVRREGVPGRLPGPDEFDTERSGHLGAAYEASWLACEEVVDRAGHDGLLAAYRAVERGVPLDRALRRHAGLGERDLLRAWQQRLRDLAA